MRIVPPVWELRNERCPCCDGQGELVFLTCPTCSVVVFYCAEVGTIFEIRDKRPGSIVGGLYFGIAPGRCNKCDTSTYEDFLPSTSDEIRALGFDQTEYM